MVYKRKRLASFVAGITQQQRTVIVGIVSATLLISLPVLTGYLFSAHDLHYHLFRIDGIKDGLLSGVFPVRIQPTWFDGHGYATSIFYGDLLLYLPALLRLAGIPLGTCYSLFIIGLNMATLLIGYHCFKKMTNNAYIGLAAAVIYASNIYRLTNLYTRAAVGEASAMLFLPLILYGLWAVFTQDEKRGEYKSLWICLLVGYTGLIQTHTISVMFAAIMTIFVCFFMWKRVLKKETFLVLAKALAATVLLNLWFLVPFFQYFIGYAWVSQTRLEWGASRFINSVVYWSQYFMMINDSVGQDLPLSVGIVGELPLSLGLTTLLILVCSFLFKRSENDKERRQEAFCLALMGLLMFIASVSFPWVKSLKVLPWLNSILGNIRLSWRLNTILAVLAVWLFCLVANKLNHTAKRWFVAGVAIVGVIQMLDFNSLILARRGLWFVSEMSGGYFYQSGGESLPAANDGIELSDYRDRLTVGESLQVSSWSREYNRITVSVANESGHSDELEVPLLLYPGYRAVDSGTNQQLVISHGASSRIKVEIPASYSGTFEVAFHSPWYWRVAELVSLAFVVFLLLAKSPRRFEKLLRNRRV
jgi:hypothetical protein